MTLSSSDIAAVYAPVSVTIPANALSATVTLSITNDGELDGTQVAQITPVAAGFRSVPGTVSIADDDTVLVRTLGGHLSGNLALENYRVLQNIVVDANQTWTIAPGTSLLFNPGLNLTANGKVVAQGTSDLPINFRSGNIVPAPGDWGGIRIFTDTSAQVSIFRYVNLSHATTGITISAPDASVMAEITDSEIHDNSIDGISLSGFGSSASATLLRSHLHHNLQSGISLSSSASGFSGTISQLSGSAYADVRENQIDNNGQSGIYVSSSGSSSYIGGTPIGSSFVTLTGNWIHHNMVGITGCCQSVNWLQYRASQCDGRCV